MRKNYSDIYSDNQGINEKQIKELTNCIVSSIAKGYEEISEHNNTIRISEKVLLSIPEASEISNIGVNKISELLRAPRCNFVVYVGRKKLVRRKEFEEYISKHNEI